MTMMSDLESHSETPDLIDTFPALDHSTQRIYGYRFKLEELAGRIKVGMTRRVVKDRVFEQIRTAGLADLVEIVFNEPAINGLGQPFRDKSVHDELKLLDGVTPVPTGGGSEWFKCDLSHVRQAYESVVSGSRKEPDRVDRYKMRDEQRDAVERTKAYFEEKRISDPNAVPRFLWNAKMRFGKTFAAYQLARQLDAARVLVVTFKPAVADAWQSDLLTHVDFEGWSYQGGGSVGTVTNSASRMVYFSSFQDLFGRDPVTREFKAKHAWVEETVWDLVIFDEFHYGAWRYADEELVAGEDGHGASDLAVDYTEDVNVFEEEHDEWGKEEREFLPFKRAKAFLYLSGTPFRALASGQFQDDQIYNWTYSDEQRAKATWRPNSDFTRNPYAALPEMRLLTYTIPESMSEIALLGDRNEFDLNTFFKAKGSNDNAEFEHKDHVQAWLTWMRGQHVGLVPAVSSGLPFPYSDTRILPYMNHTVWFLPSVVSVFAMKRLLAEPYNQSTIWGDFDVLPVAGDGAGVGIDALPPVRAAIGSGYDTKTITLTCGKLLTGVTIPQWASILMLCNLTSPETYFQAAFRVQSSWTLRNPSGEDPNEERVEKPICLVVDFAPNRALRLYADYGLRLGQGNEPETDLADLARFLPVLSFEGSKMRQVDAGETLDIALQSASIDARQMDSMRFINPKVGIAERLDDATRLALARIRTRGGAGPGRPTDPPTETDISSDPNIEPPDRKPGNDGGAGDEGDDLPAGSEQIELANKLRFLSKRINAFMYLSHRHETTLKDVLSTDETELFEQVMQLSASEMAALVRAGMFNEAALRLAILQFARAERTSAAYTGIDPWDVSKREGGGDAEVD